MGFLFVWPLARRNQFELDRICRQTDADPPLLDRAAQPSGRTRTKDGETRNWCFNGGICSDRGSDSDCLYWGDYRLGSKREREVQHDRISGVLQLDSMEELNCKRRLLVRLG